MSSSAVSGAHHARWQQMQAQAAAQTKAAPAGSSAPSSDLTDMLAGADPSQASAPPPPSTGWPSNSNSNGSGGKSNSAATVGGTQLGSAASALVSGVHSLLTSLQSESGSAAATTAGAATTGAASGSSSPAGTTASGTASAGLGTPDEAGTLGQIM